VFVTKFRVINYKSELESTPSGQYHKQKFIFLIYSINDVYGLYYRPHTTFNE